MNRILTTAFCTQMLAAPAAMADDQTAPSAPPATLLASLNVTPHPGVQTCRTSKVFALVISREEVLLPGFLCLPGDKESFSPLKFGSCPLASTTDLFDRKNGCKFDVLMKLRLANYDDAFKIKRRTVVRLSGDVRLTRDRSGIIEGESLTIENSRLLQANSFGVSPSNFSCLPSELDALSKRIGQRLCVQNDIMANLRLTGAALQTAAASPLRSPDVSGSAGDPEAITCRPPEDRKPAAHLRPLPLNCAYNSLWASVRDLPPMNKSVGAPTDNGGMNGSVAYGVEGGGLAASGVIFSW